MHFSFFPYKFFSPPALYHSSAQVVSVSVVFVYLCVCSVFGLVHFTFLENVPLEVGQVWACRTINQELKNEFYLGFSSICFTHE